MFRRFVCLLVLIVALSAALAACGDTPTPVTNGQIPVYTGATLVNLSDSGKAQAQAQLQSSTLKNAQIQLYKTKDSLDLVKNGLTAAFKQNGWLDLSAGVSTTTVTSIQPITSGGGSVLAFVNSNKGVSVVILPGSFYQGTESEISDSDTIIQVINFDTK